MYSVEVYDLLLSSVLCFFGPFATTNMTHEGGKNRANLSPGNVKKSNVYF